MCFVLFVYFYMYGFLFLFQTKLLVWVCVFDVIFMMSSKHVYDVIHMMSSILDHISFSYKSLTDKQTFFPPIHHAVFVSEKL